eukprot:3988140-Karenia_brevis.AAC.1
MSAELTGYFATIRKTIVDAFERGQRRQESSNKHVPGLVITAMTLLRGLPIKALETDKDGGF